MHIYIHAQIIPKCHHKNSLSISTKEISTFLTAPLSHLAALEWETFATSSSMQVAAVVMQLTTMTIHARTFGVTYKRVTSVYDTNAAHERRTHTTKQKQHRPTRHSNEQQMRRWLAHQLCPTAVNEKRRQNTNIGRQRL